MSHPEPSQDVAGDEPPIEQKRGIRFPTAFTVLAVVLLLVWIASFFVPAGRYTTDPATGGPIPGSYHKLPSCSSVQAGGDSLDVPSAAESGTAPADAVDAPQAVEVRPGVNCVDTSFSYRFKQLWIAPSNGLYGVEASNGFVGPWEEGFLYGSAAIFFFVLAVGAFITVTMKTGAIETGIGRLALRFRHSGSVLIAILMLIFALGGTTYGMWEETLGFFVLLVPLALALNYDRLVAAAIVFLGAGSGVIGSTVNPFATGVASDAAGISIGEGIGLRILLWIVVVAIGIGYVLWYARGVARSPERSIVGVSATDASAARGLVQDVPSLTGRQIVALVLFGFAFLTMIYGFIPWNDIWSESFGKRLPAADLRGLLLPRGRRAVPRHGRDHRPHRQARRGGDGQHDRRRRRRLPRRGSDHRPCARDHGRHAQLLHDRHRSCTRWRTLSAAPRPASSRSSRSSSTSRSRSSCRRRPATRRS